MTKAMHALRSSTAPRRLGPGLLLSATLLACAPSTASAGFERQPIRAAESKLLDIGVADIDVDGRLDVFTVNHSFPESWLLNGGGLRLADSTRSLGLSPVPNFPGVEDQRAVPPRPRGRGLYVYYQPPRRRDRMKTRLHLRARKVAVRGRLTLDPRRPHRAPIARRGRVRQHSAKDKLHFDFKLRPGGRVVIPMDFHVLPVQVRGRGEVPVRIGARAVRARAQPASFQLRDRHGYALADLDGDRAEELFEVVGGLRGRIGKGAFRNRVYDLVHARRTESTFEPVDGVRTGTCRGRHAAALDVDGNGFTDLFSSCEGGRARIYLRGADGTLRLESIPRSRGDAYRWVQVRGGARPELAVAGRHGLSILARTKGGWRRISNTSLRLSRERPKGFDRSAVQGLAPGDYNRDGELDLFVASRLGNTVLRGRADGSFRPLNPRRLGLPRRSVAAAWVDTRNSGRADLHALPQGLYRRTAGRGKPFRRTNRLDVRRAGSGAVSWADLDGDGFRDAVWATGRGTFGPQHRVRLYRNTAGRGRWLVIDTPGMQTTAEITVEADGRTFTSWSGAADGARFSQTHHRAYFGFGRNVSGPAEVTIHWPSGGRTLETVPLDSTVSMAP